MGSYPLSMLRRTLVYIRSCYNIICQTVFLLLYKFTSAYVNLPPVDVEVGLLPLNRSVTENETFPVCVEITAGILGCNITVPLEVEEGSALGKKIVKIFGRLSMASKLLNIRLYETL